MNKIRVWILVVLPLTLWVVLFKSIAELEPILAQAYATIILAVFNIIFIAILLWDRYTDKPDLEIKMEDKTEISDHRYAFKVSVLNKGRKDAHNCRVSVQVFNQKSGKIIDERSTSKPDLISGETKPFSLHGMLAFKGDFVAKISAETHKSKASKIVEYNIRNDFGPIIFKWGFVQHLRFHLKLFKKYRNEWDTEFLANALRFFSDPKIRKKLMEKLGEIGDDKVLEPIIDRLEKDPSDVVRDRAAVALGNIGDKRAIDPLLKCLREDKINIRMFRYAIIKICDEDCVKKLIDILHDSSISLQKRRGVANSLGEIGEKKGDTNIEKALIEALKDFHADRDSLCDVIEALGKVGSENSEKVLKQLDKNIKPDCSDIFKKAVEQIRFRISVGGNNIEEK